MATKCGLGGRELAAIGFPCRNRVLAGFSCRDRAFHVATKV